MDKINKKFGFGCMRLPMKDGEIDKTVFSSMIDTFIENGFNYFDTAHGYHEGKSEKALKECLTSRYPHSDYILTDKLTDTYFKTEDDIRPFFDSQLKDCGVDYFDFYLMHSQGRGNYDHFKKCRAYETAFELKNEGKIRHVGISFHDNADYLNKILTEYPQIEIVQIQFNYLDYEDPAVESHKCYDVCRKHGKPVIVMEPCKGGSLVNLPDDASQIIADLHGGSPASYAIRFAAGFDGIVMVLSGMGSMEMVNDNIGYMKDFKPLEDNEIVAISKIRAIIQGKSLIPCTACRYCVEGCPKHILIPDLFACMNAKKAFGDWNPDFYYESVHTVENGKASECIECGKCEKICPQHLEIRKLLKDVADEFEK